MIIYFVQLKIIPMNKEKICFVTSNQRKSTSLRSQLDPVDIDLGRLTHDFDEGRELDYKEVTKANLISLKKLSLTKG